jgi:hypothetical protein
MELQVLPFIDSCHWYVLPPLSTTVIVAFCNSSWWNSWLCRDYYGCIGNVIISIWNCITCSTACYTSLGSIVGGTIEPSNPSPLGICKSSFYDITYSRHYHCLIQDNFNPIAICISNGINNATFTVSTLSARPLAPKLAVSIIPSKLVSAALEPDSTKS